MLSRTLDATINGIEVGVLAEFNGLWSFEYSSKWLTYPLRFPLTPNLPLQKEAFVDGGSIRHVQWYFDNLLPEEQQRQLLAKDAKIEHADSFGLLAYYGAESAGAITLLPPNTILKNNVQYRPLSTEHLHSRIINMPKVPLAHAAIKRMSLAGAQNKLAITLIDGDMYEPDGHLPSNYILKPDHTSTDYPHSVINEWFVMKLADALKLKVPRVERRYLPAPVYLIERFDRSLSAQNWQRIHMIDACQLLGISSSFKYSYGSVSILNELANLCRSTAIARSRLFAWLVFNVLIGNSDAHLKNLSVLITHEGIELSPHYDLLSVTSWDSIAFNHNNWPATSTLAWPIGTIDRFSEVTRRVLIDAGASLNINKATAERILDNLCQSIVLTSERLLHTMLEENKIFLQQQPELKATFAGETRLVRTIIHVVIKEMVQKLSQPSK